MKSRSLIWMGLVVSLAAGCSKSKNGSDDPVANGALVAEDSLSFSAPEAGSPELIKFEEIPDGEFKITQVTTSTISSKEDEVYKSMFRHTMRQPGLPENGDPVQRFSDFSEMEATEEGSYYYSVAEINLPLSFTSAGGEVEIGPKHYYWNKNRSNNGWQWHLSGDESYSGNSFVPLFDTEPEAGIYTLGVKTVSIKKVSDSRIEIFVSYDTDDVHQKYWLVYSK